MEEGPGKKIILMGSVGSGKSTQAELLADFLNLPRINMGDVFRKLAQTDKDIRSIVQKGELVEDETTLSLLRQEILDEKYKNGFVLDGVPRNLYQAENLPFTPSLVIYLQVRDSENIKRLTLRRREDDTENVIKERLSLYHRETEPVLDFYKKQNKLLEIDGEPAVPVIAEDIKTKLNKKLG